MAQTALDVVLFVDEAERLPGASLEALAYLLRNLPPNLRAVVAARADCHLDIDDLIDYGQCAVVGADTTALQLDETLDLVHKRLGDRFDPDAAARLHDLTEGWPLGLQLALSAIGSGGDARRCRRRARRAGRCVARAFRRPAAGQPRSGRPRPS